MTDNISRAFTGDIEVRASAEGRTIAGIIVPWDQKARVSDGGPSYDEMFRRGSLAKTIRERADRVKFLSQHNARTNPLGVARVLREDAAGAYGEFVVSKTQAGDEALELVRDGALDSFSVGFTPVKHEKRDGVVVRTEVRLNEVSLVTFPAYEDARVLAVREALAAFGEDDTEELRRMVAEALDLTPATTADGQPERSHEPVDEPASATPDAINRFRHLRRIAREKGII
jgi:HK97 family phage prohead protease